MGKLKILAILLGALLLGVMVGWAVQTYVISPHKTITVEEYVLTMNVNATDRCLKNDVLRFNGTLSINRDVLEGETVRLYCDGKPTIFSAITDSDGHYEILYPTTTVGTFDFYTNATIT